jgi:hypothetical protein
MIAGLPSRASASPASGENISLRPASVPFWITQAGVLGANPPASIPATSCGSLAKPM